MNLFYYFSFFEFLDVFCQFVFFCMYILNVTLGATAVSELKPVEET